MSNNTQTHRAVLLSKVGEGLIIQTRATPQATPGSAVVRVLAASVRSNAREVYGNPASGHVVPAPFVPGFFALARITAIGPDTTTLQPGQLVFFDNFIQGRDSPDAIYISGFMSGFNEASEKLATEWRDSTYAEYAKIPLENCHLLNEARLFGHPDKGGLGHSLDDLTHLFSMLIPFGGLASMKIQVGDTVIVTPATGRYGSAAVYLALAMGARVIAMGRDAKVLNQLASLNTRVTTVKITNDAAKDDAALRLVAPAGANAWFDMSPREAETSTHFKTAISGLVTGSRVAIMGNVLSGFSFGYLDIIGKALSVTGVIMCKRDDTKRLIAMVESGVLPLGRRAGMGPVISFKLEEANEALKVAGESKQPGEIIITP